MAARKSLTHDETARKNIQTSQLINRLTKFVNGEVEMTPPQVTAALGLLRKSLPDLASIQHEGEVNHNYVARLPTASKTMDEWQQNHADDLNSKTIQ